MRRSSPALLSSLGPPSGDSLLELVVGLREPTERDRTGLFVAEGALFLFKALDAGRAVVGAVLCQALLSPSSFESAIDRLRRGRIPYRCVSQAEFGAFSSFPEPSGVAIIVRQFLNSLPDSVRRHELWLGIEHLRTAGNVGTLMRSAVASGATGIVVFGPARDRTDVYDPGTVRASMGAIFTLQLIATSHSTFRRWRGRSEITVLGATGEAPTDFRSVSYRRPVVLMLGNERTGLSEAQRATCDGLVRIPMLPGTDSLNVAMAGTVLLYEAYGQRHPVTRNRSR